MFAIAIAKGGIVGRVEGTPSPEARRFSKPAFAQARLWMSSFGRNSSGLNSTYTLLPTTQWSDRALLKNGQLHLCGFQRSSGGNFGVNENLFGMLRFLDGFLIEVSAHAVNVERAFPS